MSSIPWNRLVNQYTAAILRSLNSPAFYGLAEQLAASMITMALKQNARNWREAASKASQGRRIHLALQRELEGPLGVLVRRQIAENAELIRSIPIDMAQWAARYTAARQQQGERAEEIAKEIRAKLPHLTRNKARLIARTETAKAETAITRGRSEMLDIPWYVWETSRDQRVRKSHKNMQGVICFWNDPPAPEALIGEPSTLGHYGPGESPNCRCPALPGVSVNMVSWPHKVYRQGSIHTMTRAAFTRLVGHQLAA